jgi:hypothetical protein
MEPIIVRGHTAGRTHETHVERIDPAERFARRARLPPGMMRDGGPYAGHGHLILPGGYLPPSGPTEAAETPPEAPAKPAKVKRRRMR